MTQHWQIALVAVALIGTAQCKSAQAEAFTHKGGSFEKLGTVWIEKKVGSDASFAAFTPLYSDSNLVVIFDATRKMLIRLPKKEGMSQWLQLDQGGWNDLASERYQP